MNTWIVWTVFLAYVARNGCLCDDATSKVFVPPEKYRLPRTVLPEFYKLNIFTHINDEEGFKFYGDVRIKVIFRLLTFVWRAPQSSPSLFHFAKHARTTHFNSLAFSCSIFLSDEISHLVAFLSVSIKSIQHLHFRYAIFRILPLYGGNRFAYVTEETNKTASIYNSNEENATEKLRDLSNKTDH